jgi:hypothetical protein
MLLRTPVQLGGLAAIIAGALLVLSDLSRLYITNFAGQSTVNRIYLFEGWVGVILAVVMQLGLVGLYASQARAAGILGLLGLVVALIGIELVMGASFVFPFARPIVWPWQVEEYAEEPLSAVLVLGLSFVLGCVLLGVSILRTRAYSRAAAILFIVGALILLTPLALDDVIFAVGLAWLGYEIFAGKREEASQLAGR